MPKNYVNGSYVASLGSPCVFMHEINTLPMFSKILSTVDEIEKYERVLAIARPGDVVLTKHAPEKSYLNWLKSVGLGTDNILVLDGNSNVTLPERVVKNGLKKKVDKLLGSAHREASFSPYYGGPLENSASQHLKIDMYAKTKLVSKYDNKLNFKKLCKEVNVPVVEDAKIERRLSYSNDELKVLLKKIIEMKSITGKIIIKGEFGASGSTTEVFSEFSLSTLKILLFDKNSSENYIVEPLLKLTSSPSSLWFISRDETITHIKTSNQLFSDGGIVHAGNVFPVYFNEEKVKSMSFILAKKLAQEGYIGPFGIDFIQVNSNYYAVECNPRVTGANYPWELVHILNKRHSYQDTIKSARAENIHLKEKGLKFKDLMEKWKRALYSGDCANGVVIPYNVGPVSSGKVTVLATGSSLEEVNDLFNYLKSK